MYCICVVTVLCRDDDNRVNLRHVDERGPLSDIVLRNCNILKKYLKIKTEKIFKVLKFSKFLFKVFSCVFFWPSFFSYLFLFFRLTVK